MENFVILHKDFEFSTSIKNKPQVASFPFLVLKGPGGVTLKNLKQALDFSQFLPWWSVRDSNSRPLLCHSSALIN